MLGFDNKTIIVTGAGSGIGAACVRRLTGEGAYVFAVDIRLSEVQALVAALPHPERALALQLDVTDRDQVARIIDEARRGRGDLHGLVNSAGVRIVGSTEDMDPVAWRRGMSVNVDGTFNMCQAFARAVKGHPAGKAIVNMASTTGIRGLALRVGYSATKHAVVGLTRSMALEMGPLGLRVNAVAPGTVRTPFTAQTFESPERVARMRASIPLGRAAEPEEVAGPIAFLLSNDASYINGAILSIDGGSTIGIGVPS